MAMLVQTEFHTPAQVAKMLQVERQTVYDWVKSKQLKATKAGRMIRITSEAIRVFLQAERE